MAANATRIWRTAIWGLHKLERGDSRGVVGTVNDVMSRDRLILSAHTLPVNTCKEWVRFQRVVPFHTEALLRFQLEKLVNEVLEALIDEVFWPFELTTQDFVEDNHLGAAEEGRFSTGHLV